MFNKMALEARLLDKHLTLSSGFKYHQIQSQRYDFGHILFYLSLTLMFNKPASVYLQILTSFHPLTQFSSSLIFCWLRKWQIDSMT